MDMNLSNVQEIVEDGGGCLAAVHDATKSQTQLSKGTTTMNKQWKLDLQYYLYNAKTEGTVNTAFQLVVGVQLLNQIWLFMTPWTTARQASLSFTISWSLLKCMSIESIMPSNYLIL